MKAKADDSPPAKAEKKDEEKPSATKPKASGKLDWSKAKKSSDADKSKEKEVKVKKEELLVPKAKPSKAPPQQDRNPSPQDDSKVRSMHIESVTRLTTARDSEERSGKLLLCLLLTLNRSRNRRSTSPRL